MIGKICGFIIVLSFVFAVATGNVSALGDAIYAGAENAIDLSLSLMGMMCLWNGLMQVAQSAGIIDRAARVLSPVLKFLFPDAYKKNNGMGEIAASMSANVFGIGNGATPLAIKAMEKLQENNCNSDRASNDMIMFTVLGTASLDIFPTTLIALRRAAGSANPFEIIFPIWICSFVTAVLGILLVKIACAFRK
ncbi:MAG: nucleoside recognition protein [Clostridia bacterium]|nr:nucleoside recognition protein [Clostridia bacterium]